MPTAVQQHPNGPRVVSSNIELLSAEDFETASIRSAAPSYVSEAPSYHSTLLHNEPTPPYSPPEQPLPTSNRQQQQQQQHHHHHQHQSPRNGPSPTSLLGPADSGSTPSIGLPPVPPAPPRMGLGMGAMGPAAVDLAAFRIPAPWSSMRSNNPATRHYRNVAHRRASAAAASSAAAAVVDSLTARRPHSSLAAAAADELDHSAEEPMRPLEDPYLVGEVAARKARAERLARENGDSILQMEDRRWDLFLAQMRTWDGGNRRRGAVARRMGMR